MIDQATLKLIHVTCVGLSLAGFLARSLLMLMRSRLLYHPFVKKAPHYIDATLLASGLWMAFNLHQYPLVNPWLTAKLFALLAYILLGALALRGKKPLLRKIALLAALATFAYMVAVAATRNPFPFFH